MDAPSILVIDDEPQFRSLLHRTLQLEGYSVFEADTAEQGIKSVAEKIPDVVLLDLGLPDSSGHQVLTRLREWYVGPIIIISATGTSPDIVKALDNGANDYIVKPFQPGELTARIRASIRMSHALNSVPLVTFGNLAIDFPSRVVRKNGVVVRLTSTEYALLGLLARNENRVLTHQYLLDHAWGPENQSDTQSLRVFIGTLRKKIEDDPNNPKLIVTESGVGYRFVGNSLKSQ